MHHNRGSAFPYGAGVLAYAASSAYFRIDDRACKSAFRGIDINRPIRAEFIAYHAVFALTPGNAFRFDYFGYADLRAVFFSKLEFPDGAGRTGLSAVVA